VKPSVNFHLTTASDQLVVNSILASTISVIKLKFYTKESGLFIVHASISSGFA